jgi:RHS repeat-associated protein
VKWHRYGNAANAEENNSQNQCGILFPVQEEVSATETDLITRIKTTGKEKNYELIEYLNDVNREHAEVLVEQNINGKTDTSYIYGAEINGGFDRISLDRFDGSTGYYLYDARGSVSGITNEEGQVYQSYRYSVTGEITFGAPQYENEYTYNGESYNPNIQSQYLRARYYCVVTATFLTEDSYLGSQTEPLTLNRYNYCVSSYLNYADPSGNSVEINIPLEEFEQAQTYGDIYRLLEKYTIIEAQRMEAEHNAREQEMLNGMQRDYDSGFMKAIMELESDIGISGIYNIVVSPLRYAYQGSSDPYGEAIRNRRQNSQNFYVGVAQFGFDIVDPITHPELITGRIYSGMFAVTNDPGILFQDQMGPALDAWDAVWADDDKTHFNKAVYLFSQILAAVGLGCAKSCIDEGIATATTRTGTIGDHKGAVSGAVEWYTFWILSGCKWQMAQTEWTVCIKYRGRNSK